MNENNHLLQGSYRVKPARPLKETCKIPGDKSISHRAVMISSLAQGKSRIKGFLEGEDCLATLNAFRQMGIASQKSESEIIITGNGLYGLREPDNVIDMGNSGTGARLLLGILAGQSFASMLTGDVSLRSRPMGRITKPLAEMGAFFIGRDENIKLPLAVRGGNLHAIDYPMPVASAQVKSALLLAGLFAEGITVVHEPGPARDHTERMLKTFGVTIAKTENSYSIWPDQLLEGQEIEVPADFSSAAFFIVAASIIPESDLIIENVGINPTRTGLLDVLCAMGADITVQNQRNYGVEPVADIRIRYAPLRGVIVSGDAVVRMIDEFPIFAVAAAFATTPSTVKEAAELRVKESDRIAVIVGELRKMGVELAEREDGFEVMGGARLQGADCFSGGDHRIAMSLAIAGLAAEGETTIHGVASIATSFPNFFQLLSDADPHCIERFS
ncbi:MAG: 3-phosphoshikimate 1-carboxyvinyltransferase [Candidatus Omnitrophota bacterium]|jgi:3-phosphoshikimate 1-carboxyvinyltransferase|nr:MAG: 3-phosphoshikimate 1-carboxyvinyltransferase [Candidatus Omnitrophota bacterium]